MVIQVVVIGGPLGYIVGCFVASIFLVRKEPDDAEATPEDHPQNDKSQAMPVEVATSQNPGKGGSPIFADTKTGTVPDVRAVVVDETDSQPRPPSAPVAAKGPWGAPFGLKSSQPAVCVPRRFSVGTMMILVTACAVLLGVLKSAGVPPLVFATVAVFIGGVGACQVLMFKGTDPRRASFYGGMITFGVLAVVAAMAAGCLADWEAAIACVFWGGILAFILGGPLGYAAGCLVAAIFLVRKEPADAEPTPEDSG